MPRHGRFHNCCESKRLKNYCTFEESKGIARTHEALPGTLQFCTTLALMMPKATRLVIITPDADSTFIFY
jgi:hypothetical protein